MKSFFKILKIKKILKQSSFALNDGKYYFSDDYFSPNLSDFNFSFYKRFLRSFSINKKHKYENSICGGKFFVTPYKCVLLGENKAFYFFRDKSNYLSIKHRLVSFSTKTFLNMMPFRFIDSESLLVSDIIDGDQFKDEAHLRMLLESLFVVCDKLFENATSKESKDIGDNIYFAPQHGDCHLGNVFWKDNSFTFIDLDDIDEYPLFYDIFYLILSFYHQNAFDFFKEEYFVNKITEIANKHGLNSNNIIDKYLAAYLYFWINRMNKNTKYFDIYFYVRWFENVDLSGLPLCKKAIDKYINNMKAFRIKNE